MFDTIKMTNRQQYSALTAFSKPFTMLAFIGAVVGALSASASADNVLGEGPQAIRPMHTYSIVAHDAETGDLGVAVQSHWFSVGSRVAWAEAGVGAVATQSFTEVTYGPLGLTLMRSGKTAGQALEALKIADTNITVRQVGMVDANGTVAVHTGENAISEHCHHAGKGYTVQANLMLKETVCQAMVQAFEGSDGDLAEKLMLALEAAQGEGGDIRGKQSAALIVVSGKAGTPPWQAQKYNLRVDDHETPVKEMRRLLTTARGYRLLNEGDDHWARGDVEKALKAYTAAETIMPDNHEAVFWHAATLAAGGYVDDSLPLFAKAYEMWPDWRKLVPRLPASGLLPDDPDLIKKIMDAK